MRRTAIPTTALALGLLACSDTPMAPAAQPLEPVAPHAALTLGDGATYDQIAAEILAMPTTGPDVQQSATGHVERFAKVTLLQKYSFSAIRHTDGKTVSGRFVVHAIDEKGQDITAQGEVRCLTVKASKGIGTATIGGVVTHVVGTSRLYKPELPVFWQVVDNGEGTNLPPDLASQVEPDKERCLFAAATTSLTLLPTDNGNVQVHP